MCKERFSRDIEQILRDVMAESRRLETILFQLEQGWSCELRSQLDSHSLRLNTMIKLTVL